MTNRAWVTLATNDSYGLGALVLAHSLRRVSSTYPAVVLITPSVTDAMRDRLSAVFAEVITVDVLDSQDAAHLALLQRPELGITFTKIHCWNLTQYEKCVFLDADILVVQNCDELFEREELSAAPDVGWPDCFNSGVFVFKPSADTFSRLITFAQERGSFDGGDQGLLNSFFSDWSSDNNKRLPFLYNVTSAAFYSYLPALKHFGQDLKIIHFIGPAKPWLQHYNFESQSVDAPEHLKSYLQTWWNLFTSQVHTQLDVSMDTPEEPARETRGHEVNENVFFQSIEDPVNFGTYEPILDPASEFPWHHPDKQLSEPNSDKYELNQDEFHDPWDRYKGTIKPVIEETRWENPDHSEVRKYVWESHPQQIVHHNMNNHAHNLNYNEHHTPHEHTYQDQNYCYQHEKQHFHQEHNLQDDFQNNFSSNQSTTHTLISQYPDTSEQYEPQNLGHEINNDVDNTHNLQQYHNKYQEPQIHYNPIYNNTQHTNPLTQEHPIEQKICNNSHKETENINPKTPPRRNESKSIYAYCVHMDHEKHSKIMKQKHVNNEVLMNGDDMDESYIIYDDDVRPRHPYDGFYLRHRATIDSRGKKMCTHEIPLVPPSPPDSCDEDEEAIPSVENGFYLENEDETGVAGNLARVQPGVPSQREALDELTRRQGWESGNIDYMGADSFDNIWAKISQTLNQTPSSPPSQPSASTEPVEVLSENKEKHVDELAEKVETSSLDEANDIPLPAKEAAQATGNSNDSNTESISNTQVEAPESNTESVPQLESNITSTEIKTNTEIPPVPTETVVTAENLIDSSPKPKSETNIEVPIVPQPESVTDADLKQPELTQSTETHEIKTADQIHDEIHNVKDSSNSETVSADVHASEIVPPPSQEPQIEPVPIPALTTETLSKPLNDSSKPEIQSEPVNAPVVNDECVNKIEPEVEPQLSTTSSPVDTSSESHESKPELLVSDTPSTETLPAEPEKNTEKVEESVSVDSLQTTKPENPASESTPLAPTDTPKPETDSVPDVPEQEKTPEKAELTVSDSPPLANTPSQEEVPSAPAAKLEERRKPAAKLQLKPPTAADPLPTPDSELEDAATLAQSIIASELRTPTVTSPSPTGTIPSPQLPTQQQKLDTEKPDVPTPPVGAVSLSHIGVKAKSKPTTASQIESSVSEKTEAETPKKKVVKKVVKKDVVSSGEAPVPPPRKKEKKPKDK